MHELVQNEKKKENRARSILETRTGPNILIEDEEQQKKRIAARAANAMAQVLQRRREPRSHAMWGDRRKAIIKRYTDGRQEIIVPQTLTPEQENYEFPPRSRFLKKLATSTAEKRRISVLQDHVVTTAPTSSSVMEPIQPDQSALQEWFSKKEKSNKDLEVIEWINQVEKSSKHVLQKNYKIVKPASPTPSICYSNKIQFKSDAGKRWANSITSNASLIPPDDTSKKHYVPRRLLSNYRTTPLEDKDQEKRLTEAVSKIQSIWKDYQHKSSNSTLIENKVSLAAMSSTGQRTPISSMVYLVQMLHHTLQVQQQKSNDRLAKLESLLEEETKKRHEAEEKLEHSLPKEKVYQSLLSRVNELEFSTQPSESQELKSSTIHKLKTSTMNKLRSANNSTTQKVRSTNSKTKSDENTKPSFGISNTVKSRDRSSLPNTTSRDRSSLANTTPKVRSSLANTTSKVRNSSVPTINTPSKVRNPSLVNLGLSSKDKSPSIVSTLKSKAPSTIRDRTSSLANLGISSKDKSPSTTRDRTSSLANLGISSRKSSQSITNNKSVSHTRRNPIITSSRKL